MRRFDKKLKIENANILAEKRYLASKGLISESFHDVDGTPIGVDKNHEPMSEKESSEKEEAWKKFQKEKHVTSKTVKVAREDFEKEWEQKNK